jgi:hypothetical protein
MGIKSKYSYTIIALCIALPCTVAGQGLVMAPFPTERATIIIQYQAVYFKHFVKHTEFESPSGSMEITSIVPLNPSLFIIGNVPIANYFARHRDDTTTWTSSGSVFGTVSLGFGLKTLLNNRVRMANSLTIYINSMPSMDDQSSNEYRAMYAGWYSDPYRGERFTWDDYWSIQTNTQFVFDIKPNMSISCEFRPLWYLPENERGHAGLWLNTGMAIRYGFSRVRTIAEYVVSAWISGGDVNVQDRVYDAFGLGITARWRAIQPVIYYQIALDKYIRKQINGTFGIRLSIPLSSANGE